MKTETIKKTSEVSEVYGPLLNLLYNVILVFLFLS